MFSNWFSKSAEELRKEQAAAIRELHKERVDDEVLDLQKERKDSLDLLREGEKYAPQNKPKVLAPHDDVAARSGKEKARLDRSDLINEVTGRFSPVVYKDKEDKKKEIKTYQEPIVERKIDQSTVITLAKTLEQNQARSQEFKSRMEEVRLQSTLNRKEREESQKLAAEHKPAEKVKNEATLLKEERAKKALEAYREQLKQKAAAAEAAKVAAQQEAPKSSSENTVRLKS